MIIPKKQFDTIFNPDSVTYIGYSPILNVWLNGKDNEECRPTDKPNVFTVSPSVAQLLHTVAEEEGMPESKIIESLIRRYAVVEGYAEAELSKHRPRTDRLTVS